MYPISLHIEDKLCVVVGGGKVARRKIRGILLRQGQVKVISPQVEPEIQKLAARKKIQWQEKRFAKGDLKGAFLVFAATSSLEIQDAVQQEADALNILVNRADAPEKSSFHVPASLQRGDLQVAVFTNGKSPAMAAKVKKQLEDVIGWEYGILLELVAAVRGHIIAREDDSPHKVELLRNIFHNDILIWIKGGQWDLVEKHFTAILGSCEEIDWNMYRRKHV